MELTVHASRKRQLPCIRDTDTCVPARMKWSSYRTSWLSPPFIEAICDPRKHYNMEEGGKVQKLEAKKEQEIRNMVAILKQIDLPDILLLTRDANTLLMRQQEVERRGVADAPEVGMPV